MGELEDWARRQDRAAREKLAARGTALEEEGRGGSGAATGGDGGGEGGETPADAGGKAAWNEEWRRIGLGAEYGEVRPLNRLMFVQCGFGCDQHGYRDTVGATQAAIRACRNAIEVCL